MLVDVHSVSYSHLTHGRMYSSTFADWFSQAVIDFMLGYRTLSVFSEFLVKLQATDPRDLIHISKIRADAIATCVSRLLTDGERLLSGWTLFAPMEMNTKIGDKFEEKVLLLVRIANCLLFYKQTLKGRVECKRFVYHCKKFTHQRYPVVTHDAWKSYDYTLEKVKLYTRVPLEEIVEIQKGQQLWFDEYEMTILIPLLGAYILSPLEEGSRDSLQNAGFIVTWRNTHQDTRVTSYSIRNSLDLSAPPTSPPPGGSMKLSQNAPPTNKALSRILSMAAQPVITGGTTFAAFKALPVDPTRTRRGTGSFIEPASELTTAANCQEAVNTIVDIIQQACQDVGNESGDFVRESDVVRLVGFLIYLELMAEC